LRILNVVGARPNFVKIAPLMAEYRKYKEIEPILVHTGQHYDDAMSNSFFEELEIPQPDVNLEVGAGTHAVQTAEIMKRFEPLISEYNPEIVAVVGDVNSTLACALVAAKLRVRVAHVEAGLRSFDRGMPEEINRILTDALSDFLFVTEPSGLDNLKREGVSPDKIFFVGNVMIDALMRNFSKIQKSSIVSTLGLTDKGYALITLHRPSNVDRPETLRRIFGVLRAIGQDMPVIFPIHPRTRANIRKFGLFESGDARDASFSRNGHGVQLLEPVRYIDFLTLMRSAKFVLTDSGGIQEEATVLRVPCLTMRQNTERPVTVEVGANVLVGTDPEDVLDAVRQVSNQPLPPYEMPLMWDGHAAERIVRVLIRQAKWIASETIAA